MFRVHAQHFTIQIPGVTEKYRAVLKRSNNLMVDGNTVRLHKNSIQVYSNKDFWSDDWRKATHDSFRYWSKLFVRLENDLFVNLIKHRMQNIKIVMQHVAETNNEIARDFVVSGDKLRVYDERGKLWCLIDNSFQLGEFETLGKSSGVDMKPVQDLFNDHRDGKTARPSVTWNILNEVVKLQLETSVGLRTIVELEKKKLPKPFVNDLGGVQDYFG